MDKYIPLLLLLKLSEISYSKFKNEKALANSKLTSFICLLSFALDLLTFESLTSLFGFLTRKGKDTLRLFFPKNVKSLKT